MLMAQDPELLLVDEPVAGMTPRESERTGELLMTLAQKHTLLVIDHDMTFVRQIASPRHGAARGQDAVRGHGQEVQRDPRGDRRSTSARTGKSDAASNQLVSGVR